MAEILILAIFLFAWRQLWPNVGRRQVRGVRDTRSIKADAKLADFSNV